MDIPNDKYKTHLMKQKIVKKFKKAPKPLVWLGQNKDH